MEQIHIPEWQPVKQAHLPLYRQVYLYIKEKIQTGQWPVDSTLPPQRKLAEAWRINRSTLRIALDELIAEGLLTSTIGSSTRIANNTWSMYADHAHVNWDTYVNAGICPPNLPIVQQINRLEFRPDLIRLGTGELAPELMPTKQLQTLIQKSAGQITSFGYEEPKGLYFLREEISKHLSKTGIRASPDSILIVSGALQALQLICFSLLPPSARILAERPSYLFSLQLFQAMHMRTFGIEIDEGGIQTGALRNCLEKSSYSLLYTIPTFHNPTGILMTDRRRHELLELCGHYRLPILEDDAYRDLWLTEPPPAPLKSMDARGGILYIGTLSKSVGPGLRIGWVTGPEPVIEKLADIKMLSDYGSSSLSQWVAAEWFAQNCHEQHLERLRAQLLDRCRIAVSILEKYFTSLAEWTVPSGGFYIWLKLYRPLSMPKLFKKGLEVGILLHPGTLYDGFADNRLRISYAYARPDKLEAGLLQLAKLLQAPEIYN